MLLDICLGSKSAWRILVLYGESPGAGFTRQDLRKNTKLGNKALSLTLKRLVAFGILRKSKEQLSLAVYKLNMGNSYAKEILNLLQREKHDLNNLPYFFSAIARELAREIIDSVEPIEIYLFGSIAKGTYREDSDIDFAVVLKTRNPKDDIAITAICEKLSDKFNRKVQCFLFAEKEFKIKKTPLIKEILKHGIRLA